MSHRLIPILVGLLLLLLVGRPLPAAAQEAHRELDAGAFCRTDLSSAGAQANVARFATDRASGALTAWQVASKSGVVYDIGDRRAFNVIEDNWQSREFELRGENPEYRLWVALDDLGSASQEEIDGLEEAMLRSTPATSVDPASGILVNNKRLFGNLPDMDGDGILDILMYDMKAGDGPGTVVLGYVSSSDLIAASPDGTGNRRDVLYLDAVEGSANITRLASVAAHELTHLIHFGYRNGRWEETFIQEGLAEFSMVFNGFHTRGTSYLSAVSELAVPLFTWRQEPGSGGPNAWDYQRASLFFSYLAERMGVETTASILRGPTTSTALGTTGLSSILTAAGLSLATVVADFHTANRLNDRSLDPAFGYEAPSRALISTNPTRTFGPAGQTSGAVRLFGGAVEYYSFSAVDFFDFSFDTPTTVPELRASLRRRMRGRAIFESYDGVRTWEDLAPVDEPYQFRGPFRSVQLVLANVTGTVDLSSEYAFEVIWTAAPAGTAVEDPAVARTLSLLGANYPNPFSDATTVPIALDHAGPVRLSVFDLLGRRVATPIDRFMPGGSHEEPIRLGNLAPGSYFLVLETGPTRVTRTITITR